MGLPPSRPPGAAGGLLAAAATAAALVLLVALHFSQEGGWRSTPTFTFINVLGQGTKGERLLHAPWQPLLTEAEQARGIAYYGSGSRLRRVADKLLAGQPVSVYFLGGSVTFTAHTGTWQTGTRYAERLSQALNASFPHSQHVFVDKSMPGSTSSLAAPCAASLVPPDADLVILEFTFNDAYAAELASRERKAYEQLMRRLLALPGVPAVVELHHYAWWKAEGDGVTEGLFYTKAESQLTTMAQYYDVPALSLRAAAWQLMHAGVDGFKVDKMGKTNFKQKSTGRTVKRGPQSDLHLYFYQDSIHPTASGHTALADLLVGLLRRAVREAAAGLALETREDARLEGLPPPMIPGNPDQPISFCALLEDFKPVVKAHEGFEYRAERPNATSFAGQKWGWTGLKPGAWAELELDTRSGAAEKKGPATVILTYLRTYEHAGLAHVTCASGCTCAGPTLLNTTNPERYSTFQTFLKGASQHARCRMRVEIIQDPGKAPEEEQKVMLAAASVAHRE